MNQFLDQTPYEEINAVLCEFAARIQSILAGQFLGMYLYGSLALGDFNPQTSDIDFIVVTKTTIPDSLCTALQAMHDQFTTSGSPWADRIEAAYIPQDALHHAAPTGEKYPQIEKGAKLVKAPLEIGWAFQLYTLRERGVTVAGPDPQTITNPVDIDSMRLAAAAITLGWQEQASQDPDWQEWVRHQDAQSFVVLTLCRMLFSIKTGDVASKPAAARWAKKTLGARYGALIDRALTGQHAVSEEVPSKEIEDTLAFIRYLVEEIGGTMTGEEF